MRVLVVDDERLARDRLNRMVNSLDGYEVVGDAASGEEALLKSVTLDPDIVLLDIRMPGMDGLSAGEKIAELQSPPALIFCTAFSEHAIEAFDLPASGYLLKPVRRDALAETLSKVGRTNRVQRSCLEQSDSQEQPKVRARTHISARTRRGIELVPLAEIRYFLADHKYVTVRYDKGEVLVDDALRDLEEEFASKLVRIHRNALVMVDHLEGLDRNSLGHYQVRLRGIDERLDVSRRHIADLRKLVQAL